MFLDCLNLDVKGSTKTVWKNQKPASALAEFEAKSVQNCVLLYVIGTLSELPVA